MKTLTEQSIEYAFSSPERFDAALTYAETFTARHAACAGKCPAQREAAMLNIQFPAILQDPVPGDRFVGRIRYGLVGFSPEPIGLGYYCATTALNTWLSSDGGSAEDRTRVEKLLTYWQGRTTTEKVRAAYSPQVSQALPSDAWTEESGIAFPLYRMAGTVLDYSHLIAAGLDGLEAEWECCPDVELATAGRSSLETLRHSIRHYARTCVDSECADSLRHIQHAPPATFHQAVQLFWLYALHAGTWNYGRLDVTLGPLLAKDLDSGRLTETNALEMLCSLWKLIHAYNNQYNNRIIIGGKGRPDPQAADRFALLAIEATRRVRLNQPQLSLRFYDGQNPQLWERALDAIGEGCTFPMLYNDDVNIPAVARAFSVSEERAADYTPYGCGEYVLGAGSQGTPNGVINLLKALEVALHAGVDPLTGCKLADIPPARNFSTFEDLWNAYTTVVDPLVAALAEQEKCCFDVTAADSPFLLISQLTPDCIQRGRGAFGGGSRHLGGTLESYGNTNAADSLHVINELVFRRKEIGLPELVAAMDANFEGYGKLLARCRAIQKYGNDEAVADAMARRVHDHICTTTRNQAAQIGLDTYLIVIINNWANTILGWKTSASADGRLFGEPMANGNNPAPGADTSGATAFLNSLAKLDPSIHAGAVQNMKFSKEWFGELRPKFSALLQAYFAQGGTQAMITVVSLEDLKAAMAAPEKWGHLMVRVGGFSIRFIELPYKAQLEVLERTLH